MAFVASPRTKILAKRRETASPPASGVGPDTAEYGRVWPNEWPNGQLHHGIQRRCVAPVTIETATGAPGGWASPCRRAQRRRSTAATDGASLRVSDASCPRRMIAGSPRQPTTWATSRREPRARQSCVHGPCGPGRALALFQPGCERDLERGAGDRSRRRSSSLDLRARSSSFRPFGEAWVLAVIATRAWQEVC
jgi:hypothetical protein